MSIRFKYELESNNILPILDVLLVRKVTNYNSFSTLNPPIKLTTHIFIHTTTPTLKGDLL